jgi:AbiV family abortive infection protein
LRLGASVAHPSGCDGTAGFEYDSWIMPKPTQRDLYYQLYTVAHNNAAQLLADAEILFERQRYARAYSLAFTALEELSKSQLAADVATEYISEEDFQKVFLKHEKKIERMAWATKDAEDYLSSDGTYVVVQKPTFTTRNDAMYVNLKDGKVYSPADVIGREEAEGIIHTVNVAIQRIVEVQVMGEKIGTKGFMK